VLRFAREKILVPQPNPFKAPAARGCPITRICGQHGILISALANSITYRNQFRWVFGQQPHGSERAQYLPRPFLASQVSRSRSWHYGSHMDTAVIALLSSCCKVIIERNPNQSLVPVVLPPLYAYNKCSREPMVPLRVPSSALPFGTCLFL
jgi:hypothetical protein